MIDKKQDLHEGLKWWKRASEMRVLYHSVGLVDNNKQIAEPVAEMGNITEYQSVEDVENMQNYFTPDYIKMQSLLVRQRLLGFKHPDTTYYIRYRGAVLADSGDYSRCLKLWRYVLKNLVEHLDSLCCNILLCAIQSYVELFGFLFHTQTTEAFRNIYPGMNQNLIDVDDILSVMKGCVALYNFHKNAAARNPTDHVISLQNKTDSTCMKLICKLTVFFTLVKDYELKPRKGRSEEETASIRVKMDDYLEKVEVLLAGLVHANIKDQENNTLLHIILSSDCCGVERHQITDHPHLPAVEVLLKVYRTVACNVDQLNKKHFTPLELLVKNCVKKSSEFKKIHDAFTLFEKYGAHTDCSADTRPDFCPLLIYNDHALTHNMAMLAQKYKDINQLQQAQSESSNSEKAEKTIKDEDYPMYPLKVQSLQCLSAVAVMEYSCDFTFLEHLIPFVLKH